MITEGLIETDNNKRTKTLTGFFIVSYCNFEQMGSRHSDHNKLMITYNRDHIMWLPLYLVRTRSDII